MLTMEYLGKMHPCNPKKNMRALKTKFDVFSCFTKIRFKERKAKKC